MATFEYLKRGTDKVCVGSGKCSKSTASAAVRSLRFIR